MKKKSVSIIVLGALLLVIGILVWLVLSGRLVVALKDPGSQYSIAPNVCGSDIVESYNEATNYEYREGSEKEGLTMDVDGLRDIANRIKESKGYESDPTCQTILFWTALGISDVQAARAALEALEPLHDKRIFPDSNLRSNIPLSEYGAAVERVVKLEEKGAKQ